MEWPLYPWAHTAPTTTRRTNRTVQAHKAAHVQQQLARCTLGDVDPTANLVSRLSRYVASIVPALVTEHSSVLHTFVLRQCPHHSLSVHDLAGALTSSFADSDTSNYQGQKKVRDPPENCAIPTRVDGVQNVVAVDCGGGSQG